MRKAISAALLAVILVSFSPVSSAAQPVNLPSASAYIDVGENGNANVTLVFSGRGFSTFWITLPKFEKVRLCGLKGGYALYNETSGAYFYYNTTVTLHPSDDGSYELRLCFSFPYAVLMQGDRAWFMSPLLTAHSSISIAVFVKLPLLKSVVRESPSSVNQTGDYRVYILSRTAQADLQGRVVVEYTMRSSVPSAFISSMDGRVRVEYPQPYTSIANKTLEIATQAYSQLRDLTGIEVQRVDLRFYLPEQQMGGLGALGFVRGEDVNAGGRGPIMLNLALIRFAPGYHETTVVHEMIHVFLGAAGVEANANTRWFHEGVAQYVSLIVAERIGVNVSEYHRDLENGSRAVLNAYRGKLSFIEKWPSGSEEEAAAYLASYYIIANISSRYGQASYIARLFSALSSRGGAKTTREIVLAMSEAARTNLAPLFREWGFSNIEDWQDPLSGGVAERQLAAALVLLGIAAGALVYILNTRVRRELELLAGNREFFR
ncbi:MAG: hypothetical protein QW498_00355 [Thermofilum sp.]